MLKSKKKRYFRVNKNAVPERSLKNKSVPLIDLFKKGKKENLYKSPNHDIGLIGEYLKFDISHLFEHI